MYGEEIWRRVLNCVVIVQPLVSVLLITVTLITKINTVLSKLVVCGKMHSGQI